MRWVVMALVVGGCSSGVEGDWLGNLQCGGFPYNLQMSLEKESGLHYIGTGEQEREYTSVEGQVTQVVITFDADVTMAKGSGSQQLDVTLTCLTDVTVETPPGGGDSETVAEGCEPLAYRGYAMAWDGEDEITVAGATDACEGSMIRRE